MDEKKIEFLILQIKLGNIIFDDVPERFREAVTEKWDGDYNFFYKPTISQVHQ